MMDINILYELLPQANSAPIQHLEADEISLLPIFTAAAKQPEKVERLTWGCRVSQCSRITIISAPACQAQPSPALEHRNDGLVSARHWEKGQLSLDTALSVHSALICEHPSAPAELCQHFSLLACQTPGFVPWAPVGQGIPAEPGGEVAVEPEN